MPAPSGGLPKKAAQLKGRNQKTGTLITQRKKLASGRPKGRVSPNRRGVIRMVISAAQQIVLVPFTGKRQNRTPLPS